MVVAKKRYDSAYYNYGNYAYDYKRYQEYEQTKKDVNKSLKAMHMKKVKKQFKLLALIFTMFCIGILIIGRYVMIMDLNNQVGNAKTRLEESQKENENLRVALLQHYDIKQVEEYATTKLNMVRPEGANTVYISMASAVKNNDPKKVADKKDNVSFASKLFSSIF